MAEYLGFPRKNQEGIGTACNVLCVQVSGGVFVQGTIASEEEANGK